MRKVKYPFNSIEDKNEFCLNYYNLIASDFNENEINVLLKRVDVGYDLKILLTSDFSQLLQIQKKIKKSVYEKQIEAFFVKNRLKSIFNIYENNQAKISNFFMNHFIGMNSCHYCNIDYINTFEKTYTFKSKEEFLRFASKEVLMKVEEISKETADIIYKKQFGNNLLADLKGILGSKTYMKVFTWYNSNEINNSSNVDFKRVVIMKNHFTLDHVLPKKEFPFLSLSIFNLVPSCYSCNSKFKHQKEFTINDDLVKFCPTSDDFMLDELIRFKMKFDVNDFEFDTKIKNIKQIDDIIINVENVKSLTGADEFVEIFNIDSRYEFHKNISFDLIEKRKTYPDSQIHEIEKLFRDNGIFISKDAFKKHIFGSVIFETESTNEPFEKYKKDIAKQLGII